MYIKMYNNVHKGVNNMTQVSITELRNHIKKYSELVREQDFEVVNRGEVVFVVKSPKSNKEDAFNALMGAVKSDIAYEDILEKKVAEL